MNGGESMDNKVHLLNEMQKELDCAHKGNIEVVAGENYYTAEYVYHKLKATFEDAVISEQMLKILVKDDFPLSKMYDFFADHDYFRKEVNWSNLMSEYCSYRELEFVSNQLHDKVEKEYISFMESNVSKIPYKISKLVTEIAVKMLIYNIFRYQDCFELGDMKTLLGVEQLLEVAFTKVGNQGIDSLDEKHLWTVVKEALGKVIEEENGKKYVERDSEEIEEEDTDDDEENDVLEV